MAHLRLGVDIGGTFTDHVLLDAESGTVEAFKTPTTPDDLSRCVLEGVRRFVRLRSGDSGGFDLVAHGTTVNTNAILERRGARCGLITTRGFRDVLEIGRQTRPDFYNWFADRPEPLIPRRMRLEVHERVTSKGEILSPLDEQDVHRAIDLFRQENIEAVAICLINAYANPIHEQRIRDILRQGLPGVYLSISSEINPEFREFERTSTAAAAAYVGPLFARYMSGLVEALSRELTPAPPLFIMQSSGGMISAGSAIARPHATIESGPAAGAIASVDLGRRLDLHDLISFDMGGTTAKACLIRGGTPSTVGMLEVGGEASGFFGMRIVGLPIKCPSIDLVECSAGGGSVAWVDVAGVLKVGPESAGAVPGPACYDAGGARPTVTDAHVVLGRIDADTLLGGTRSIRPDLAARAIEQELTSRLGLPLHEAAQGVLDVVNAKMVRILRLISVMRGFDPRDFTLVAHGGAGPMHAGDLAEELGIGRIVVPPAPGLFSAMGLLASDIDVGASATRLTPVSADKAALIEDQLMALEAQCRAQLDRERVPDADRRIERHLAMRYVRQNFELDIPVVGPLASSSIQGLLQAFHEAHQQTYGHSNTDDPVEILTYKIRGIGRGWRREIRELPVGGADAGPARTGTRRVFFRRTGWIQSPIYDRTLLGAGNRIEGPAVINEFNSTILVLPDHVAVAGRFGELLITHGAPQATDAGVVVSHRT